MKTASRSQRIDPCQSLGIPGNAKKSKYPSLPIKQESQRLSVENPRFPIEYVTAPPGGGHCPIRWSFFPKKSHKNETQLAQGVPKSSNICWVSNIDGCCLSMHNCFYLKKWRSLTSRSVGWIFWVDPIRTASRPSSSSETCIHWVWEELRGSSA